jgi:hypothetical protein
MYNTRMTNNNTAQESTMNEVAAAVQNIIDTKFISSGFVIQLTIVNELTAAGFAVSQENIDKIQEMINI